MPNVLVMTAFELRDPLVFLVQMKADDTAFDSHQDWELIGPDPRPPAPAATPNTATRYFIPSAAIPTTSSVSTSQPLKRYTGLQVVA